MSTATSGRAREYRVRDHLAGHGYVPIMRASGSKGAADLLLGHPFTGALLVQVGAGSKRLGPAARERLCQAAELTGAEAVLAVATRRGITYWAVSRDIPSRWEEWTP